MNVLYTCASLFFFFNDTATTEIYPLSLHDALPIWLSPPAKSRCTEFAETSSVAPTGVVNCRYGSFGNQRLIRIDRKSTRLNSSHLVISYAVFCLKKKNKYNNRSALTRARRATSRQ